MFSSHFCQFSQFSKNKAFTAAIFASKYQQMGQHKNSKYFKGNLLPALAILLFLAACSNGKKSTEEDTDSTIAVQTEILTITPFTSEIAVSGNIEGSTTVKLGFMVPGKVNLISGKTGQFLAQGQLIASLDPTNYALNKQLADLQLNEVSDEYNRLKILYGRGSLSESDFTKIGFSLQSAQLKQKLELKNLNDTRLYAPIGGVLLSKQAEVGEIISAGTPLFVVADIRKVKVLAFIPEGELNGLHIGQDANVNITALDKSFIGKITEVGAVADAASRAFMIKIELDNAGLQVRPGMVAEISIARSSQKTGIQLPPECIINELGNQSYVYVADKVSHKAFKRRVSLGKMMDNKIEILSGLSLGEEVITSGQTKLSDGSLITIVKY